MSQDHKQLVREFYARWDAADPSWGELVHDEFALHIGGLPVAFTREQMDAFNERFYEAFTDRRHEFPKVIAEGDIVASRGTFAARLTGAYGGETVAGVELVIDALVQHQITEGLVATEWLCVAPRPNDALPAGTDPFAELLHAILATTAANPA